MTNPHRGGTRMTRLTALLAALFVASLALIGGTASAGVTTTVGEDHPDKVFVCKYVGTPGVDERLQTGDNPISVSVSAIPAGASVGAYFADAQGRSYVLAFDVGQGEPSVDSCPAPDNPPDIQVTAGVTFNEATCTTGPSFTLVKTNPGLRFYNVEGPLVDGKPIPGGSYTITPIVDDGYVNVGPSVFTHTFAAAPTNCGTPGVVTGNATVICVAGVYKLSGTVDGQAADKVEPSTLPGSTKGVTNVTVTRGDTSVRTTVTTLGDCGTTTTVTAPPPPVVTPPAPPVAKPPAAKPPKKVAVKKPVKKKATSKVKPPTKKGPHVCLPLKDGTERRWWKGGNGMPAGCYAIVRGSG